MTRKRGPGGVITQTDRDNRSGRVPTPDRDGLAPLQDHVVADDRREPNLGGQTGRQDEKQERDGRQEDAHHRELRAENMRGDCESRPRESRGLKHPDS